jgi:PAS domain S-box-containing protein
METEESVVKWGNWPLAVKLTLSITFLVILAVASATLLWVRYQQQVMQSQDVTVARNLGFSVALGVGVLGIVVALLISRSVTRPLQDLTAAMKRFAQGDFSRKIPVIDQDVLSTMSTTINEMVANLQQMAEQRGAIVEAIFEGIVVADHRGQIIELNPAAAKMFGCKRSEVSKLTLAELVKLQPARGPAHGQIGEYLQGGEGSLFGHMIEAVAHRLDGSEFPIEWAITRISATQPPMFTIVVHDLTERKRIEEELRQAKDAAEAASRAKSSFLANMSHELRTPLSAIIGYSELLQEEAMDRGYSDLVADLEKIQTAGQHLVLLINGILDLSKVEAGKLELHLETFDLVDLVEEVAITARQQARKGGNTLEINYAGDAGSMHADRIKVQQILLNLLNNAAKFTSDGRIVLTVFRETDADSEWVCFRVADTGIGISPQQMENLFQPFTQADPTIAREYGGSGLGLAISRSFCRKMGGDISVESEVGKGSTFTVRIRAVVSAANSNESAGKAGTPPGSTSASSGRG